MQSLVATNRWKWSALRKRVLVRDSHRCQLALAGCTGIATEVDHIRPRVAGGGDDMGNLRAVCSACHKARGMVELERPRHSYASSVARRDYTRPPNARG